jgi:hypothetical protein
MRVVLIIDENNSHLKEVFCRTCLCPGQRCCSSITARQGDARTECENWAALQPRVRLEYCPADPEWCILANPVGCKGAQTPAERCGLVQVIDSIAGIGRGTENACGTAVCRRSGARNRFDCVADGCPRYFNYWSFQGGSK